MARRALIVANGRFADAGIAPLDSPVSDGTRLRHLLERADIGGYQVTLCGDDTTMATRLAVHDFFDRAEPGDLNLMVYSGHGLKDRKSRLYFATHDTLRDRLSATALSASYIRQQMTDSRASQKILIIDACFSGTFIDGMTAKKAGDQTISNSDFGPTEESGTAIVTATTAVQLAGEKDFGGSVQSVFTRSLIEAIESGDADASGDGRITLIELFDYLRERMKSEAPGQTPHILSHGGVASIVLARNPHHRKLALDPKLLARIAARDKVRRGSAVEDLEKLVRTDAPEATLARAALERLAQDDSLFVREFARAALARLGGMVAVVGPAAVAEPVAVDRPEGRPEREPEPEPGPARMLEPEATPEAVPKPAPEPASAHSSTPTPIQTVRIMTGSADSGRDGSTTEPADTSPNTSTDKAAKISLTVPAMFLLAVVAVILIVAFLESSRSVSNSYAPEAVDTVEMAAEAEPDASWLTGNWVMNQPALGCSSPVTIEPPFAGSLTINGVSYPYTINNTGDEVTAGTFRFTKVPDLESKIDTFSVDMRYDNETVGLSKCQQTIDAEKKM